ncbi:uncharacterized protein LOC111905273 [Lactuca sativa]|uniref:uncharacterized protein LOC111905273 n=1 Tax=Lactuca sativa TaxID=4236 RepID=UPI000CD99EB6|nr:uncharacterized protein LOC111905273 [Lactuca sativa]
MASSSSSSSFPYLVLACLNFTLFILSAASLAPTLILKSSPTSMGWALVMVSSISLLSSFIGFFSHFCFMTHVTLLIASMAAQMLAILALFTKEKSSLSMLKSPRDPREAMALVRVECGVLVAMFVLQVGVFCLSCGVHWCWVRKYEGMEAAMRRSRSRRVAEEPVVIGGVGMKGKELEKMKVDFEA